MKRKLTSRRRAAARPASGRPPQPAAEGEDRGEVVELAEQVAAREGGPDLSAGDVDDPDEVGPGASLARGSADVEVEHEEPVRIPAGDVTLSGDLVAPVNARGIVLFAHGSGSSRVSPRNRHVAAMLRQGGLATVLMDLLTRDEEAVDARTAHLRFDITFLARRLVAATDWLRTKAETRAVPLGYFGASTGAAAALVAAAERPETVRSIVSRGGRPDLAGPALARVRAPTLLIVGSLDHPVIRMNREALARLTAEATLEIVPGATHLFEEPGTLDEVARLARAWFERWLTRDGRAAAWL
jgi:putative phosphoribosyl transferase